MSVPNLWLITETSFGQPSSCPRPGACKANPRVPLAPHTAKLPTRCSGMLHLLQEVKVQKAHLEMSNKCRNILWKQGLKLPEYWWRCLWTHLCSGQAEARGGEEQTWNPLHTHQHLPGQALDNLPGHTIALDFNENTKSRMPPLKSPTSVSNVTKSHSFLSLISALRKSFSGICWEITICVLRCLISNGNSSSLSQLQGAVYILQEQEQARPDPRGQHGPGGIRSEGRPQAKEVLGWS